MKLTLEELSAQGDKEENQDYKIHDVTEHHALFVVADGLGGGKGGDKASRYFCQGLVSMAPVYCSLMARFPEETFANWIQAAVDKMGVLFAGDEDARNGYTTCAILYLEDDLAITAHCGDTRIYRLKQDGTVWRTRDHSVVQMLVDQKNVDEAEMGNHPLQHKLTRCISLTEELKPEIELHSPPAPGDTFLLCTDGVWGHLKQSEIAALAKPECNKKKLAKLMRTAYLRADGYSDNLTLQWVRVLG